MIGTASFLVLVRVARDIDVIMGVGTHFRCSVIAPDLCVLRVRLGW